MDTSFVLQRMDSQLLNLVMHQYEMVIHNEKLNGTMWWDPTFVPTPGSVFGAFDEDLTINQMLGKVLLLSQEHKIFFRMDFDEDNLMYAPIVEVW